jgi:hypothetical protein
VRRIFLLLLLTGCDKVEVPTTNTEIESPIQNTCQSGDLLPDFPRCGFEVKIARGGS